MAPNPLPPETLPETAQLSEREQLLALTRPELNDRARDAGVLDPESFANKNVLVDAMLGAAEPLPVVIFVPAEDFNAVEIAIQELGHSVVIEAGQGYGTNDPSVIAQLDAADYVVRYEPADGGDDS